jgi:hypothetical protein
MAMKNLAIIICERGASRLRLVEAEFQLAVYGLRLEFAAPDTVRVNTRRRMTRQGPFTDTYIDWEFEMY